MEVAGLALGAIGVASLFQACLATYGSVNVYRNFQKDSGKLRARFDANKLAFQRWGSMVRLGESDESPKLQDPEVQKHVRQVLLQVNETLSNNQKSRKIADSSSGPESLNHDLSFRRVDSISAGETTKAAWRQRTEWVLRGKEAFEKQLEMLEGFVNVLYRIIPDSESTNEHLDNLDKDILVLTASLTGQSSEIQRLIEIIEQKKVELEELITSDAREKVLKWLNPLPSEERYIAALRDRVSGTCEWLFEREEFQDWRSEHPRIAGLKLLWVHGPAGFGKTFTAARAVEALKASSPHAVAHFFCTSENETMRKPVSVLRTWLAQMVRQNENLLPETYAQFRNQEQQYATEKELWHLFETMCGAIPNAVFVVDGVDELVQADPRERLEIESNRASFLEQLVCTASSTNCSILITSRKTADIETAIKNVDRRFWFEEIAIVVTDVQSDVGRFSKQSVQVQLASTSEDLQEELTGEIATKSEGMFLLVRLWTSRLSPGKSTRKLRATVSEMPKGLDRAFERDLAMINDLEDDEDRARAVDIIRWTMFANRALTVGEMTDALIATSDEDSQAFPEEDFPSSMGEEYVQKQLLHLCGSLLEVRKSIPDQVVQEQTVHFVHFTAREFLSKRIMRTSLSAQPGGTTPEEAHMLLAESCLRYLCYDNFDRDIQAPDDLVDLYDRRPFLRYASNEWHSHTVKSGQQYGKLLTKTQRFLTDERSNWKMWAINFEPTQQATTQQDGAQVQKTNLAKLLYYVTRVKYPTIMRTLLEKGSDPNATGGSQGCAVQAAAFNADKEAIKVLMEYNVDLNGQSKELPGTIGWAIPTAPYEFVVWLLSLNIDISFCSDNGHSPLQCAVIDDRPEIVSLLLDHGAPVDARSNNGATALHFASSRGMANIAKMLLQRQANVLAQSDQGVTPLHDACMQGHTHLVKLLLEQPNGKSALGIYNDNFAPLHTTAWCGWVEILQVLVEDAGAEINAVKQGNFTPLFFAARQGKLEACRYLLEHGAAVTPVSDTTWSILHAALESTNEDLIGLILSHDPPIHFQNTNFLPPLSMAALKGLAHSVKILVEKGALVNGNEGGKDPLPYACRNGDLPTVEALLKSGANIEYSEPQCLTALEEAAKQGHDPVVQLLLSKGAQLRIRHNGATLLHILAHGGTESMLRLILEELDRHLINHQDDSGRTAIFYASERGADDRVAVLIAFGANVNTPRDSGATALHEACRGGHRAIVEQLIIAGANINARMTNDRGTPFYVAVQCGYRDLVEYLYEHSADVNMGLKDDWTPIIKATYDGREEIVQCLLRMGADFLAQNHVGNSALHYAVGHGAENIARMLLEYEASHQSKENLQAEQTSGIHRDVSKSTPIPASALSSGGYGSLQRLVDLSNRRSLTALHWACQQGNASLARLLVSYGADSRSIDCYGHSCEEWAASMGDCLSATGATNVVPTPVNVRKGKLHETLRQLRGELPEAAVYYTIGQCFTFLGDLDAAAIAFEQKIWYDDNGRLHHHAICNACQKDDPTVENMSGSVRWVCVQCFDQDLCNPCLEREKNSGWPRFPRCKNHEFLQVPRESFKNLKTGSVNEEGTSFLQWLDQRLARLETLSESQ